MRNFIDDGYTETGVIPEAPGIHDAVEFQFRPMLYEEVEDMELPMAKSMRDGKAKDYVTVFAEVMKRQLLNWSLKDNDGVTAPITADNIRRLRPALFEKMRLIIMGRAPNGQVTPAKQEADAKN